MADQDTTNRQERLVDVQAAFVADAQTAELVQPTEGAFDDPAEDAQSASVFGVALGNAWLDTNIAKRVAMLLAVVASIGVQFVKAIARRAGFAFDSRHVVDQIQQLADIMTIGGGRLGHDGHAATIGQKMVLTARFSAVYRAGAGGFAPPTARMLALSTTARLKSIWSAARSWPNRISWIWFHTPACFQSRNRRQQVMPDPQFISLGSISQGMPDMSTKRTPVKHARSGKGLRPGLCFLRGRAGRWGSMTCHNSSETSGLAMSVPPCTGWFTLKEATCVPFC